ncbi:ATP-binding protein [Patescibacteria group bacterium]|jgi:two-component system phosphate regulon sensor histidine kinase PhoR|nr:ATP-binding protein [Patescibacteria group bacterium]
MLDEQLVLILAVALTVIAVIAGFSLWYIHRLRGAAEHERLELRRQVTKASILAQLARRIGYTFDAEEIIEVISSSLNELLSFRTISYLVYEQEKHQLKGKIVAHEPTDPSYIEHVRKTMLEAFKAMRPECADAEVKDLVLGPVSSDMAPGGIGSFFNLPIVFDTAPVGIITVTSPKPGLYTDEQTEILYTITQLAASAVTQLRKVIQNEQMRMDAMVSSMVTGLFMLDSDERLLVLNAPMRRILGMASDVPVSVLDVLEKAKDMTGLAAAIKGAKTAKGTVALDPVHLNDQYYQISVSPVHDPKGEWLGTVVIFEDITTQKSLERLREQFTAMMVHELRGPLTAIRWNLEILRDKPKLVKADVKTASSSMMNTTTELLQLVTDMLDAEKIEEGRFEVKKTEQDFVPLAVEVVQSFEAMAKGKGIDLSMEATKPRVFSFDPGRMKQVLTNLVSNAVKYTEAGSISVHLSEASADRLRVEIIDTGMGVQADEREKLFKRYGQTHTADKKGGTGLGLLISKGIVEAHGGTIGFTPHEPRGSIFWFEIPKK